MAMTINENRMNPIPLWDDKSKWQCNSKTFHDAMAWPVVQNGVIPLIALTVKGDMPSGAANAAKANVTASTYDYFKRQYKGTSSNPAGTSNVTLTGLYNPDDHPGDTMPQMVFTYLSNGRYSATVGGCSLTRVSDGATTFTITELSNATQYSFEISGTQYTLTLGGVDINYHGNKSVSIDLRKFEGDTSVYSTTQTLLVDGCLPYYSSDRVGQCWLGGQTVTSVADGVYYIDVVLDGVHYYSEPFLWLTNVSNYTLVTYRRSDAVVTRNNCIVFTDRSGEARSLSMYIQNVEQKPPYQFDAEVTDIDGRKFAEKQVSYYNKRLAFHCYEAFLEAIRLLWHCDTRYMGSRRIDYMEPPEMDWNTDNHLCDVVLDMSNYDDVIQTNGTASSYYDSSDSSHQSYDASFDASFN